MFQISRNALIRCGTISDFQSETDGKQEVLVAEWQLVMISTDESHQVTFLAKRDTSLSETG